MREPGASSRRRAAARRALPRQRRRLGRIDPEERADGDANTFCNNARGFKWRATHARLRHVRNGAAATPSGAPRRAADAGADAKGHGRVSRSSSSLNWTSRLPRGCARRASRGPAAPRAAGTPCRDAVLACNAADSRLADARARFGARDRPRRRRGRTANRRGRRGARPGAPPFASKSESTASSRHGRRSGGGGAGRGGRVLVSLCKGKWATVLLWSVARAPRRRRFRGRGPARAFAGLAQCPLAGARRRARAARSVLSPRTGVTARGDSGAWHRGSGRAPSLIPTSS